MPEADIGIADNHTIFVTTHSFHMVAISQTLVHRDVGRQGYNNFEKRIILLYGIINMLMSLDIC